MAERDFPLTFRAEVIKPLTERLRHGETVALVGVASIGKGNLMRQFQRRSVREHFFRQDAPLFAIATVDCLFLPNYSDATIYAEFLDALAKISPEIGADGAALQPKLQSWAREALTPDGQPFAQKNLREALRLLLANPKQRIALMLDDCDALIGQAAPALLRSLRALRDAHKDQFMYVTLTRRELARLRPDSLDFEHFFELSPGNTLGLKPYREQDALIMLDWMSSGDNLRQHELSEEEKHRLYLVSGGHAGLLKQAYIKSNYGERANDSDLTTQLLSYKVIRDECAKILESLDQDELEILTAVARNQKTRASPERLKGKGILAQDLNGALSIFSPLFAAYLLRQSETGSAPSTAPTPPTFELDTQTSILKLNGRSIHLDAFEVTLMAVLLARRPEPLEDEEMRRSLEFVQPDGVLLSLLYQTLARLQTKLNTDGRHYLVRAPDTRWRLVGDHEI